MAEPISNRSILYSIARNKCVQWTGRKALNYIAERPGFINAASDLSLKLSKIMMKDPRLLRSVFDFSDKILRTMSTDPNLSDEVFNLSVKVFNDLVMSSPKFAKSGGVTADYLVNFLSKIPLLDIPPIGIVFIDFEVGPDGKIDPGKMQLIYANSEAKKLFGRDVSGPLPLSSVLTEKSLIEVIKRTTGAKANDPRVQIPLRMKTDKREREIPIQATPRILLFKDKPIIAATVERSISSAIQDIGKKVSTMTDMKEIVECMLNEAMDLFDLQATAIKVDFDLEANSFKVLGRVGLPDEYDLPRDIPLEETASFQAQKTRTIIKKPQLNEKTSSAARAGMTSAIFVPLWVGSGEANIDPVGTWCLYISDPGKFGSLERKQDEIERFAQALLSIRIRESRLYAKEQSQKMCKELLNKISQAINSPLLLNEVLSVLVHETSGMFEEVKGKGGIRSSSVCLVDEGTGEIEFAAVVGRDEERMPNAKIGDGSVRGTVAMEKKPLYVPDAKKFFEGLGIYGRSGSFVSLPIMLGKAVLGILNIASPSKDMFNEELDGAMIKTLAEMAGAAIKKAELLEEKTNLARKFEVSNMLDDLTPTLFNHGMAEYIYLQKISEANSKNKPLSLIYIDIDNFKKFNERFGHLQGTQKIKEVGGLISRIKGPGQYPCKFGGDEFLVILFDQNKETAHEIAKKLQRDILKATGQSVTIGISSFPVDGVNFDEVLSKADTRKKKARGAIFLA